MAKGARASTIKANNAALKRNVFGPVEDARTARLSAKLLELASQPKPETPKDDANMETEDEIPLSSSKQSDAMEIDADTSKSSKRAKSGKGKIERKRSSRKAAIVFPKYKKGGRVSKSTKSKK